MCGCCCVVVSVIAKLYAKTTVSKFLRYLSLFAMPCNTPTRGVRTAAVSLESVPAAGRRRRRSERQGETRRAARERVELE